MIWRKSSTLSIMNVCSISYTCRTLQSKAAVWIGFLHHGLKECSLKMACPQPSHPICCSTGFNFRATAFYFIHKQLWMEKPEWNKISAFRSWQNLAKFDYTAKFSYLTVVFHEKHSWKDHLKYVSGKVSRRLELLSHIRSFLTLEASVQTCTSLLQPLCGYAVVSWGKITEGCCKELQCLRNQVSWVILWRNTSYDTFRVLRNYLHPPKPKCDMGK